MYRCCLGLSAKCAGQHFSNIPANRSAASHRFEWTPTQTVCMSAQRWMTKLYLVVAVVPSKACFGLRERGCWGGNGHGQRSMKAGSCRNAPPHSVIQRAGAEYMRLQAVASK